MEGDKFAGRLGFSEVPGEHVSEGDKFTGRLGFSKTSGGLGEAFGFDLADGAEGKDHKDDGG